MLKIHLIAAARPNFMKIAPLYHALKKEDWANPIIVHTGQHYDLNMSDVFFQDLMLPEPHIHLGIGGGGHSEQTGKVMMAYEKVLITEQPDLVVVVGDVNATMACTLATIKIPCSSDSNNNQNLGIDERKNRPIVAHLEAGLRSFDRSMPEEINRIVTDSIADILWTPSPDGDENLLHEGIAQERIIRVGNIMLDSFEMLRHTIKKQNTYSELGLKEKKYAIVTLHRPVNVDLFENLSKLCDNLISLAKSLPLCFPLHPRTKKQLLHFNLFDKLKQANGLTLIDPLNYVRFMNLVLHCRLVITDSGGLQEESTYLGIPCITLRTSTERPITITQGTNTLSDIHTFPSSVANILATRQASKPMPDLWDGKTASRVVGSIRNVLIK